MPIGVRPETNTPSVVVRQSAANATTTSRRSSELLVCNAARRDEDAQRAETETVLAKLKAAVAAKQDPKVQEDLQIMIRRVELGFRIEDYERAHEVPFHNASEEVFSGVRLLLDDQTPEERRPAAVLRVREYAGLEAGYTPITEILKKRTEEQMAKTGVLYPARVEIETEMSRNCPVAWS